MQDELVLVEHTTDNGDISQIIYRNGGLVDAQAVEMLCDKVCKTDSDFCEHAKMHANGKDTDIDCHACRLVGQADPSRKCRLHSRTAS